MNTKIADLAMYVQSAPFAALFLDALLKSVIVLALAGGACVLWRGASAATRHLIWFLAVAGLPFLPLLSATHPAWQKPVWTISTAQTSGNQMSLALELAGKPSAPAAQNPRDIPNGSLAAASTDNAPSVATHFNAHWMLATWLVWLAGVTLTLIWIGAGQFYRGEYSRTAKPLDDPGWTQLLNDACKRLNLRRRVVLLVSADEVMPMTWGWLRPVVLLPRSAAQWPEERRRVVLLHELAHVKRGDYFTQMVAQVVCAIYWFNPLVWVAARQMRLEREGACDDLVLAGGCRASEYAGHLVEIAGRFRSVPQLAAIAMARSSRLEGRIAAIVDGSRNRRLRLTAVMGVLALIGGIAVSIGGTGDGDSGAKVDPLRSQQIERLEAFSVEKEKQSETLAAAAGDTISPDYQRFFDAAEHGDWQTVTNMFESFKGHHPQYSHPHQHTDVSLRTSYWGPALEICLAYENVIGCAPAYTQMAVDDIIHSIPPGSIYFGGTDPGRGLPTAFSKSQVDADPFYTLTQNALADGTYLEYLDRTYGWQRPLLRQMAEACRADSALQDLNAKYSAATQKLKAMETDATDQDWKSAEENVNSLWSQRDERMKTISAQVRENASAQNETGVQPLYVPTAGDSQQCFQDYMTDAKERFEHHQLKPDEDVKVDSQTGQVNISGRVAVMEINARIARLVFDKNPGHEFYIEESYPLDWMYPYMEPHGLIMKINRQPLAEMTDAMVRQDRDYWQPRVNQMIGGWLGEGTSVKEVTAFDGKIFLRHDLGGFSGDLGFVQNDYATKMFSKFRTAIAGLYAWRAENAASADEKQRMAKAADFAFRQALALCPASSDTTTRYAEFLKQQHRDTDAKLVEETASRFKSATVGTAAPVKPSVLQIRLALDVAATNAEPMRLESRNRNSTTVETVYVAKEVLLDQTAIQSATFDKNQFGYLEIEISMTDSGARKFAEITRAHVNQRLAIVMDGKLWTAPVINMPITGGKAKISGSFSDEEAKALVAQINDVAKL